MMSIPVPSILLAAALLVAPGAQDRATARQLFDAGSAAYDRGRYDGAARAFEAAYELLPSPAVAFSLAQAQRRQYFVDRDPARLLRAIDLYRGYLDAVPAGGRRADVVQQLQELEPLLSRVDEDAEQEPPPEAATTELMIYANVVGAKASIDGGPFVSTPVILAAEAGPHEVVVRATGFVPSTSTPVALAGRLIPVEVRLLEEPARLRLQTNRGAWIVVDGREVGRAPLPAPIELASGSHSISVRAPGRVRGDTTLVFARGQTRDLSVRLPPTQQRQAAWGLLGSSAGLLVAGGVTLGLALGFQARAQRVDALRGERNIDDPTLEMQTADIEHRDRLRGATIGLWTAAVVTAAVGVILVVTDRGSR